jgi:hypothetical protein
VHDSVEFVQLTNRRNNLIYIMKLGLLCVIMHKLCLISVSYKNKYLIKAKSVIIYIDGFILFFVYLIM